LLREIAAQVNVSAPDRLLPLLRQGAGIEDLTPLDHEPDRLTYDGDVELMELPHVFRTTLETIPANVPYLQVEPAALSRETRLAVGLVWQAGNWDDRRSIPFPALRPLLRLRDITFHVMQREPVQAGWTGEGALSGGVEILEDAKLLRALDLLITVDTMPAHLAGALGVPVWTLLCAEADWRWLEKREDSPWYPTMRLFRQKTAGDWDGVIAELVGELSFQ
jgi:hypothetical protein